MSNYNIRRLISFSFALAAIFASAAVFHIYRAEKYERRVLQISENALSSLIAGAEAMEQNIKTMGYSDGGVSLASAAANVWSASQSAQAALSALDLGENGMPLLEKLINQAGEYSLSLMLAVSGGGNVSRQQLDDLSAVGSSLTSLCSALSDIKEQLDIGEVTAGGAMFGEKKAALADTMSRLEKGFDSSLSLVYDGGYSEHISDISPLYTQGMEDIGQEKALKTAAKFLGVNPASLKAAYQSEGTIPVFGFTLDDTVIEVTKNGGMIVTISSGKVTRGSVIDEKEARQIALQTAENLGYSGLKCRYTSVKNNVLTAELVGSAGDVTVYPDRVTVRVAMDNGSIVGFDASGYIMSNTERTITPPDTIPEGAALALIPTDGQNEKLCFEYMGDGHLRYVCCESGLCYSVHSFGEGEQDGFIAD